jgi:hypothetical protein
LKLAFGICLSGSPKRSFFTPSRTGEAFIFHIPAEKLFRINEYADNPNGRDENNTLHVQAKPLIVITGLQQ